MSKMIETDSWRYRFCQHVARYVLGLERLPYIHPFRQSAVCAGAFLLRKQTDTGRIEICVGDRSMAAQECPGGLETPSGHTSYPNAARDAETEYRLESADECAVARLNEEAGLAIDPQRLIFVSSDLWRNPENPYHTQHTFQRTAFYVWWEPSDGEPRDSKDLANLRWMLLAEAAQKLVYRHKRETLQKLLRMLES